MAREQARRGVIAAAGAITDDQIDLPAAVELRDRVLRERGFRQQRAGAAERQE